MYRESSREYDKMITNRDNAISEYRRRSGLLDQKRKVPAIG